MANKNNKINFHKKMVLFKYILNLFSVDSIENLAQNIKDPSLEEIDSESNQSLFYQALVSRMGIFAEDMNLTDSDNNEFLSRSQLEQYDENIRNHTKLISEKREQPIKWKYFQYLELLFTEIYLDKYFSNKEQLLSNLNNFLAKYNQENLEDETIEEYSESDLNKLAFWAATGSGKTLILHVNILQIQHYLNLNKKSNLFNRILLITPNEGLSKQHLEELKLSNINARIFDKSVATSIGRYFQGSFLTQTVNSDFVVDIIEITKLAEIDGEKTIAIDTFESNNLIFVDEGHRGTSGDVWKKYRDQLSQDGFCFEYSATFGQAVKDKKELVQEYAKCILFDYSYKYFYADGYGKEYQILNLSQDFDSDRKTQYLIACLLSFFQQVLLFKNKKQEFSQFLIENPLWIFVGSSVNAVRTENKKQVSDVVDILLFINDFVSNRNKSIEFLNNLIQGQDSFLNKQGLRIFENKFNYLLKSGYSGTSLYNDILKYIFNCDQTEANLYVENLKGADGEIGLRLGDNDYFGVINVGDSESLVKLCDANHLNTSSKDFAESLFHSINKKDSKINLLIGSKKFSEGWSSWRVSTMGLMNVGKSEGAQIIQLFGRGIRLKGANFCLKRSYCQNFVSKLPEHIDYVETLNIFGIKADYMAQFRAYLEEEGVPTGENKDISIPTISYLEKIDTPLKMPKLRDDVNFKRDAGTFDLGLPPDMFKLAPVTLDLYSQVEIKESIDKTTERIEKEKHTLSSQQLQFIDYEDLYFEAEKLKNENSYYNMNISFETIKNLIHDNSWYELYIPASDLEFSDFNKVIMYQNIAKRLIRKYCEKFYNYKKNEWEAQYRIYADIDENDANMIKQYKVRIQDSMQAYITNLEKLKEQLIKKTGNYSLVYGDLIAFDWDKHLFTPLISCNVKEGMKISPVQLNPSEMSFVKDLKDYYDKNQASFEGQELYLLRNQSKGTGVGFFEANNFYPDFVMWLIKGNKQYITFIDPKGIAKMSLEHPKIQFYKTIKDIQSQMNDENIILNSVILSNTHYEYLCLNNGYMPKHEYTENHVIFQQDSNYIEQIFSCIN